MSGKEKKIAMMEMRTTMTVVLKTALMLLARMALYGAKMEAARSAMMAITSIAMTA